MDVYLENRTPHRWWAVPLYRSACSFHTGAKPVSAMTPTQIDDFLASGILLGRVPALEAASRTLDSNLAGDSAEGCRLLRPAGCGRHVEAHPTARFVVSRRQFAAGTLLFNRPLPAAQSAHGGNSYPRLWLGKGASSALGRAVTPPKLDRPKIVTRRGEQNDRCCTDCA